MKKLLLGLGTLATIVAPIATVVSCGAATHTNKDKAETPSGENNNNSGPGNQSPSEVTKNEIVGNFGDIATLKGLPDGQVTAFQNFGEQIQTASTGNLLTGKELFKTELDSANNLLRFTYKDAPEVADEAYDEETTINYTLIRITVQMSQSESEDKIIKIEKLTDDGSEIKDVTEDSKDFFDNANFKTAIKTVMTELGKPSISAHDNAIANAKDMITELLGSINYDMSSEEQSRLVDYLVRIAGDDSDLHLDGIDPGRLVNKEVGYETHGADDYMVLIKGAAARELNGDEWSTKSADKNNGVPVLMRKDPDSDKISGVGAQLDPSDHALEDKWGETTEEVKEAKFVIYFQTNDETGETTCQVCEVVKHGEDHYELDTLEKTMENRQEEFNKEFALKEFVVTEGGPAFAAAGGDAEYKGLDGYRTIAITDNDGTTKYYSFTDEDPDKTTTVITAADENGFENTGGAGSWKNIQYDFTQVMKTLELRYIDPAKDQESAPDRRLTDLTPEQFQSFSYGVRAAIRKEALKYLDIITDGTHAKQVETLAKAENQGKHAITGDAKKLFIQKFMEVFDQYNK